jgi:hypothetical protein
VEAVRVDVDWLRSYAKGLDNRVDEAQSAVQSLTQRPLQPEAFGELGRSLRIPEAYQRAADELLKELRQAETVLTAAAGSLREAADHYAGQDEDAAITLQRKGGEQ